MAILAIVVGASITIGHLRDHHQPTMQASTVAEKVHAAGDPMPANMPDRPSILENLCRVALRSMFDITIIVMGVLLGAGIGLLGRKVRTRGLSSPPSASAGPPGPRTGRPSQRTPSLALLSVLQV